LSGRFRIISCTSSFIATIYSPFYCIIAYPIVPLRPLWRREIWNANEPTISGTIESSRVGFSRRSKRSGDFSPVFHDTCRYRHLYGVDRSLRLRIISLICVPTETVGTSNKNFFTLSCKYSNSQIVLLSFPKKISASRWISSLAPESRALSSFTEISPSEDGKTRSKLSMRQTTLFGV